MQLGRMICVSRELRKVVLFEYTTLLCPFGEKNRLKANFFLLSLDYANHTTKLSNLAFLT